MLFWLTDHSKDYKHRLTSFADIGLSCLCLLIPMSYNLERIPWGEDPESTLKAYFKAFYGSEMKKKRDRLYAASPTGCLVLPYYYIAFSRFPVISTIFSRTPIF
jgi:hypothetical protein